MLSKNGILNFITSNKWLRANYGKSFRRFLIEKTEGLLLIDFNYIQIFDEASVDTNILEFKKGSSNSIKNAVSIKDDFNIENIQNYILENSVPLQNLTDSYWNIISEEKRKLNSKLKDKGNKILDWDISINYGIKTGFNEAFIIDETIKDELIRQDPNNANIIVPYLRGRDTRRYGINHEGLWLVAFLPSRRYNINDYPIIKDYLQTFGKRLEQSGERGSRKKTSNKWFETQDSISYWKDFDKPKLIYAETMRIHKSDTANFPRFGYDDQGYYCDKTTFIITGNNIKFLLAILNSKVGNYLIREYVTKLDTGGYMMQKVFIEEIPIMPIFGNENLSSKVDEILAIKNENPSADTADLEAQIDQLVYELYDLTPEEIEIIENEVK